MKEKTLDLIKERGNFLIENWDSEFSDRSEFWNKGPSKFFYEEIIKMHKEKGIENLLEDRYFYVCVYGALASWGLDRMGKGGPKMRDFDEFKEEIEKRKEKIISLSQYKTFNENAEKELYDIFNELRFLENKTKIVANSKVLHFLVPRIAPIVDREYILRFFKSRDLTKYPSLNSNEEGEIFLEITKTYHKLLTRYSINDEDPLKIIDNGIVNYVRKKI